MRRRARRLAVAVAIAFLSAGCLSTGTTVTPNAALSARQRQLWQREQVKRNLDRLRDTAMSANASDPPIVSDDVYVQVLLFHKTMMTVVIEAPFGWQRVVESALEQLKLWLGGNERLLLGPYMDLIRFAVKESQPVLR